MDAILFIASLLGWKTYATEVTAYWDDATQTYTDVVDYTEVQLIGNGDDMWVFNFYGI